MFFSNVKTVFGASFLVLSCSQSTLPISRVRKQGTTPLTLMWLCRRPRWGHVLAAPGAGSKPCETATWQLNDLVLWSFGGAVSVELMKSGKLFQFSFAFIISHYQSTKWASKFSTKWMCLTLVRSCSHIRNLWVMLGVHKQVCFYKREIPDAKV